MKKAKDKTNMPNSSMALAKKIVVSALLAIGVACSGQVVNVAFSTANVSRDQPTIDFLNNNFQNINVTYGDYSNPANIPSGTDLLVIGRNVSSTPFANSVNSATFNALTYPVVCLTSYVARPDSGRWGWHSGGATGGWSTTGAETTVTAAGISILGVAAGTYDWVPDSSGVFYATGAGTVGDGQILATIGGDILAAGWIAGQTDGSGDTFGGNRLLFNLQQDQTSHAAVMPTGSGQQAFINAMTYYTGLQAVPEPRSMALASLGGGLALLMLRRRQTR